MEMGREVFGRIRRTCCFSRYQRGRLAKTVNEKATNKVRNMIANLTRFMIEKLRVVMPKNVRELDLEVNRSGAVENSNAQ